MPHLLQNWVFNSCDKKQGHENQCGMGNEGGGVQYDSTGGEVMQLPTGAHVSLISNQGDLNMK